MGWGTRAQVLFRGGLSRWARFRGHTNDEGAAYVEYVTLVIVIGILVATALLAVGVPLLRSYRFAQVIIAAPIP